MEKGLSYDDVLLVPQYSTLESRSDVDLTTRLVKNVYIRTPILSANMDTITELTMAIAMHVVGGIGVIHRFMSCDYQAMMVRKLASLTPYNLAAIGVHKEDKDRADQLVQAGLWGFVVDVAHGDSLLCNQMVSYLKKFYPDHPVIAGNVATYDGTKRLIDSGADGIKVGVGSGSVCSTRIITGCGVPQLTAIMMCSAACEGTDVTIIADGGIRNSGDLVKALAAGANSVMIGNLFAGTEETPGEIVVIDGKKFKSYRGMASRGAMDSRSTLTKDYNHFNTTPEGVEVLVPFKGTVMEIINDLSGGIRSGMSYCGADTIRELQDHPDFVEITNAGRIESEIHNV